MALQPGSRLGAYEIVSLLGAGGMGEVYRANDTRLDRTVAIKILPEAFAADPQLRDRFQREARAISQLNHANVCVLHDIGESEGTQFLVMEHLEGETLEERLARGPLPLRDALTVAMQMADALFAAHRAGIVHRDLKPGNIYLTKARGRDGSLQAKLLDFGLAKTAAPAVAGSSSMAPTTPPSATAQGAILGTFQYMAPEQIEGVEADARTDIFAFGAVLFEMLTGKKAFEGKSRASLLGAILKDEPPPVSRVLPVAPAELDRIVRTCLEKEPENRWQSARDVLRELKWVADGDPVAAIAKHPPVASQRRWIRMAAVSAAALAGLGVAAWAVTRGRSAPDVQPVRFAIVTPASHPLTSAGPDRRIAVSPDGRRVVYRTTDYQLMIRAVDRLDAEPIGGKREPRGPFFSPDGNWVGFFQGGGSELRKVSVAGGADILICRVPGAGLFGAGPRGASWSANGTIVFATGDRNTGLLQTPAGGGEPVVLTKPDASAGEEDHIWPSALPNGDAVLFTITTRGSENTQVAVLDLQSGKWKPLIPGIGAHYVDSGHLVYGSGGNLYAVPFDPVRHQVTGDPVRVIENVATTEALSAATPDFSVSRTGTLVYAPASSSGGGLRSLVWVDRQGREEPAAAPSRPYISVRLSPDGTRVATDISDEQNDIWIWDVTRQTLARLTFGATTEMAPTWFPDGRDILYSAGGSIFRQSADGRGAPQPLSSSTRDRVPVLITSDGKQLLFQQNSTSGTGGNDLMILGLEGKTEATPLMQSFAGSADVSPDGRWIAYRSVESGRGQIYVRPFPQVDAGKWLIPSVDGRSPVWNRNGRELFILDGVLLGVRSLMAVPIQTDPGFQAGNPVKLFEGSYGAAASRPYDVTDDGKRFLMIKSSAVPEIAPDATPASLVVVVNWTEELKRLVPARK